MNKSIDTKGKRRDEEMERDREKYYYGLVDRQVVQDGDNIRGDGNIKISYISHLNY